jgi:hypothetical protein
VKAVAVVEQDLEAVAVGGALAVDVVVVADGAGVAVAGIGTVVIEVGEEIVAGNLQDNRIVLSNREPASRAPCFCLTQRTRRTFPAYFAQRQLAPPESHLELKSWYPGTAKIAVKNLKCFVATT